MPRWYWSAEEYEDNSSYAWHQYFNYGYQGDGSKSFEGPARAVRRFTA